MTVANHIRDDNMAPIAAPDSGRGAAALCLAGHSMGGYIAFEIMRQAPERVAKLALLIGTQARPDTPEATARRRTMMARAKGGEYRAVLDELFSGFVHPRRAATDAGAVAGSVPRHGRDVGLEGFCASAGGHHRPATDGRSWRLSNARRWCFRATTTTPSRTALSVEMADNIHNASAS